MTIAEFLLARVEEDEVIARAVHRREDDEGSFGLWYAEEAGHPAVAATSQRVLAECEAKRRIVELLGEQLRPNVNHEYFSEEDAEYRLAAKVLLLLAAPYADHPDHDPSWALA